MNDTGWVNLVPPAECNRTVNDEDKSHCGPIWDSLMCWPRTRLGETAVQPCFSEFRGVKYDPTENATKQCFSNGTWHPYSDYSQCKELPFSGLHQMDPYVELKSQLYIAGYGISFSTLVIAVIIYLYYRELRCLRNVIHTNLMVTYILADFLWIITTELQLSSTNIPLCIISYSLTRYFQLTNFFWMFVEGLYLYMLVVKTFSGDTIKLKMCLFIGWGLPLLITGVWTVAKSSIENNLTKQKNEEKDLLEEHCALMMKHQYDWVYELSAISVLCINVVFLFAIMWVLITKLRSANTVETQQYRKAAKALLVLIPLLGVSYILTLYGPTEGRAGKVFQCFRAILLSSQGLSVALFYCFLNSEVRNALRHHWERWRTERSLGTGQRYHAQLFAPCSRTESMSLYYLSDCTVDQPLQSQHQTTILKKPH